jgi:hypothetical protein
LYLEACRAAYRQGPEEAATALQAMLDRLPPSQPGWSIPIEPCFRLIRAAPAFQTVIADLASRAR